NNAKKMQHSFQLKLKYEKEPKTITVDEQSSVRNLQAGAALIVCFRISSSAEKAEAVLRQDEERRGRKKCGWELLKSQDPPDEPICPPHPPPPAYA
ncbi:hypothetical protein CHARACLAT_008478, partial [Characodon lateralis]|nr:hypothetical protein [Characodon lateralis]